MAKEIIEEYIQEIEDTIASLNNLFDKGIIEKNAYFKAWNELEICRQNYLKKLDAWRPEI
jgi:hypothetical protein